ncbi:MAG: biotin--[acetyl-CoA-carboxylase] ligase [Acidobacteriota bacterium]|jgi:BirA family biotin operon repressor/biotin-[acetyl-CoA-carboxylase] ligase
MTAEPGWVVELRHRRRGHRVGGRIRYLDETLSTNDLAREWLDRDGEDGVVVLAGHQTRGRGRRGRRWESPSGGLYASIGLRPRRLEAPAPCLTFLGAVAAAEVLRDLGLQAVVRWPNDVDINGEKVAGVLVESRCEAGYVGSAVVGIGVNLGGAEGLPPGATGILQHRAEPPEPAAFVDRLLSRVESWYLEFPRGCEGVVGRVRELCPGAVGATVLVDDGKRRYPATTRGVADDGALRLELPDGDRVDLRVGELVRLREA